jgi:hypothetical protein
MTKYIPFLFLLLLSNSVLPAQVFTVGVKGGVPLTGDLDTVWATSESKRFTVGPTATVGLPAGFRLEVDALYRHVGYRYASSDFLGDVYAERDTGSSWEFPIVLRKTLWHGLYAGVGYAPRVFQGSGHVDSLSVTSISPLVKQYSEFNVPDAWGTTHGVVAAAGIEKRFGHIHIAPEVRYTYWNKPSVEIYGSRGFQIVTSQHQVDLLLGITFP